MKSVIFNLFLALILCFGCGKDESPQLEPEKTPQFCDMEQIGLLGEWEIQSRTTNGITPLIVFCCEFINLEDDDLLEDCNGAFKSEGVGYETEGFYTVNADEQTISFVFNNKTLIYGFQVQDTIINFEYTDDGNQIEESWAKVE